MRATENGEPVLVKSRTDEVSKALGFGRLMAATVALWLIADLLLRLLPMGWLHLEPDRFARRLPGRFASFIPDLQLRHQHWLGQTALGGNIQPEESRPPIWFSTDRLGYRRTPGVEPNREVEALVFGGESFAYGGGLSDDETLSAVLTREAGLKTYNAGRFYLEPQSVDVLDWLLGEMGRPRPAVILLCWENSILRPSQVDAPRWESPIGAGQQAYHSLRGDLDYWKRRASAWWRISPLEIAATRLLKRISDDRILPNPYLRTVTVRRSAEYGRMLFLNREVRIVTQPPDEADLRRHVEYYRRFQQRLRERGLEMFVVLLPNKFSLYGPLFDGERARHRPPYLDELESRLAARGIAVLNGLTVLRPFVREDLRSGLASYYREEHHWTPLGVSRIATALGDLMRRPGKTDALQ